MQKQLPFEFNKKQNDFFGGSYLKNSNAKTARPLDSKLPVHLVLKSAKSEMRLFKNFAKVNEIIENACRKHGVRLYKYSNNGNHLHLVIKIASRRGWAAFIREVTGRIAQTVQGLKGRQARVAKFWLHRPFTRVVRSWQKAFRMVCEYVELNILEAEGHLSREQSRFMVQYRSVWDG